MQYEAEKAIIERNCYFNAGLFAMLGIVLICASAINYMSGFVPTSLTVLTAIVGSGFFYLALFPFCFGKCKKIKNK